ncbi:related to beta-1,3 exoglucanase precursor [Phialocephala subalpina]|uniref:Related to beta-1,3 exoglucanase n=1 Tax=Phialocephala subalpina TaxID=576137 RepID=A0A1L7XTI0_9HELO|nr:related to beta-1,3 exoglucanase precursor [Phialocephala subalpina]
MLFSKSFITVSTLFIAAVRAGYNGTDGHKHHHQKWNGTKSVTESESVETHVKFVTVVVSKAVATTCVTTGTEGGGSYSYSETGSGSVSTVPTSSLSGSGIVSYSVSKSESGGGSSSVPTTSPSVSVSSSKTYTWGNSSTISTSTSESKSYSVTYSGTSSSKATGSVSSSTGSSSSLSTSSGSSSSGYSYSQSSSSLSSSSPAQASLPPAARRLCHHLLSARRSPRVLKRVAAFHLPYPAAQANPSSSKSSSSSQTSLSSSTVSKTISSSSQTSSSISSSISSSTSKSSSSSSTTSSSSSSVSTTSSKSSSSSSSSSSKSSSSSVSSTSSTSSTSSSSKTSSTSSSTTSSTSSKSSTSSTSNKTSSSSSTSSATPSPTACSGYWMEGITHQGIAPFNAAPGTYQVFRNVKDFGAKGDGVTDDTVAINNAISSGNRCAPGSCGSSTTTPAVVYFPNGTYLVSNPGIIDYYYTQIIGNPIAGCIPTIKAAPAFTTRWLIDGDQYQAGGALGYGATNVFWRQIRNFIIDLTSIPGSVSVAAIHWPTAQATSLQNIVFKMSTATGNQHQGIFIEQGSGGFMTDLVFNGGFQGMFIANQQFTMRNLTFNNVATAIFQGFDWSWTYKGISINNCQIGIDMTSVSGGNQSVGAIVVIDSDITNTPIGVSTVHTLTNNAPDTGGSLILENVRLTKVTTAVQGAGSSVLLAGSAASTTIAAWGQGHKYGATGPVNFQGPFTPTARVPSLLSGTNYYSRSKPQYENLPVSAFLSVRSAGATGNGKTDDSAAIQAVLTKAVSTGQVVYFDSGDYLVTTTIYFPPGIRVVGEAYAVILSSGSFFASKTAPKPVVQVGKPGDVGTIEWSDMIVSSQGAQAGAILIEWNLASSGTPAGMWDVHTRVGGFAGSNLQLAECPVTNATVITNANVPAQCEAAFLSMHVTSSATGLYMENVWLWVADHDVEDPALTQITIYAGRGLLIESVEGNNWLYGTAVEHHSLYQYSLANTGDLFMGFIQTETAYYQPNPDATVPFPTNAAYSDPTFVAGQSGWGLHVAQSHNVTIYGQGLYSFFSNNNVHCSDQGNGETCQGKIFSVDTYSAASIAVYGYSTVGTTNMITLGGTDIAPYAENFDGFVDTIAIFREY